MELSYKEKLRLDNSQEHLKVVLININDANEQLQLTLTNLGKLEDRIKELELLKDKIKEYNFVEYKRGIHLENKKKIFVKKVNSLVKTEKDISSNIKKEEKRFIDIIDKIKLLKSDYENTIRSQQTKIETFKDKIAALKSEISTHEEIKTEKLSNTKKLEDVITRLNREIEEAQKRLNSLKIEQELELSKAVKLVEIERNKIKNPLEALKLETEKLENLKRDLDIIKSRLTKQFNKQNPEAGLPIELQ